MSDRIRLHPSAGASEGRGELVCEGQIPPRNQGGTAMAANVLSAQSPAKNTALRWGVGLLIFCACATFSCAGLGVIVLDLRPVDFRPGIGDPEQAKTKIKN